MDRIKIALNLKTPGNYAFFCPVSRLHLTRSNPVGFTDRVTSAIFMGLNNKSLIDVDGVVDLKTGKIIEKTADSNKTEVPVTTPEGPNTEENKEFKEEQVKEKESKSEAFEAATEVTTEEAPKKRGRRANNKLVEEASTSKE